MKPTLAQTPTAPGSALPWIEKWTGVDLEKQVRELSQLVWENHIGKQALIAVLVALLLYVGHKFSAAAPQLRRNCLRVCLLIFIVVFGWEYWRIDNFTRNDLPAIGLKAFNSAGLVLGVSWIVLPVLSFVFNHLRLVLAAVLGYCGYVVFTQWQDIGELNYGLQGFYAFLTVALTLLVAWILHPIWDYVRDLLPKPKRSPDGERARVEPPPQVVTVPPPPVVPPMPVAILPAPSLLPVPVTSVDVMVPQLELVAPPVTAEQRRRDRIRLQIEMAYVLATPHLTGRLPREAFNELLSRYLGDHLPIEDVEENSRQLLVILQEHQKQSQFAPHAPAPTLTSVAVLAPPQAAAPMVQPTAALEELLRRILEEQRRAASADAEARFKVADGADASNHAVPNGEVFQH